MLKLLGAIFILISCYFLGNQLAKKSETILCTTKSMKALVSHINLSIKTLRTPLKEIFTTYEDSYINKIGLNEIISSFQTEKILKALEDKMTADGFNAIYYLFENLGGIDIEDQCRLCQYVEQKLSNELEIMNNSFKEKKRMYQFLPILCGLSLIILLA